MQKDPFSVLGLDENATQAQVEEAYAKLKKQYQEDMFSEGQKGYDASKSLSKLEDAYLECRSALMTRVTVESFGSTLGKVEALIKEGKLDEAQKELDSIETRDGEWHYFQAIIFYKRDWNLESKKQLQIALAIDPNNTKYKSSLDKIENLIKQQNPFEKQNNFDNATAGAQYQDPRAGYAQPRATGANDAACCNTCSALCCMDTCCECMGGDCISCC